MKPNYHYFIVENSDTVCEGLKLRMQPYTNWICLGHTGNVPNAIEQIKLEKPDLLFLDWGLNGGSGFEIWEAMQNIPNYNPYIVFNTAYQKDNPDIPEQLINKYKVDKYIVKPIWENLRQNLGQYLLEAAQKATSECNRKNYCIKTVQNKTEVVNLNNLVCIVHDKAKPRFKLLYFTNRAAPIIINENWDFCYTLLFKNNICYFSTNDKKV